MKKQIAALVFLAAAALPVTALADSSVTKIGTIQDGGFVDETNLLKIQGDNGYALADLNGNVLTEAKYSSFFYYSDGYMTASYADGDGLTSSGILDLKGNEVVPFQYGEVKILGPHWAVAFKLKEADANNYDYQSFTGDNYYLIDTADIYYLDGEKGNLVSSLPRENYMDADAHGSYIAVENRADSTTTLYDSTFNPVAADLSGTYDTGDFETDEDPYVTFVENGQEGLKDQDGNVVLQPSYAYISSIYGTLAEVSTGDKFGIVDLTTGQEIVPAEYDEIEKNYYASSDDERSNVEAAGYFAVVKDGKLGYVDASGNVTAEPTYSKDIFEVNGASATYTDMENKVHILAADGTDTVADPSWEDLRVLPFSNGLLYKYSDEDYNYYLIDWHGNELLKSGGFSLSGDGTYLLSEVDYENGELYQVDYDLAVPAAGGAQLSLAEEQTEAAAAQTPADTSEGAAGQTGQAEDTSAAASLLQSAASLASADASGNQAAIKSLLQSAVSALGSNHADAAEILNSALSLLDADTVDGSQLSSLLDSALQLLG